MTKWDHQNRDNPFNEAASVTLDPGERAEVTFEPENRVSDYFLPTLAVSKHPNSSYEIQTDGTTLFGPAPIPPTDPDDDSDTFRPPETFADSAVVIVENLDSTATRTYYIQVIGWERRRYTDEGGW